MVLKRRPLGHGRLLFHHYIVITSFPNGSYLSRTQKRLVLEAMKPWVYDMENAVAANLLKIYGKELDDTYISFTGDGVAGDQSSFLVSNTNYVVLTGRASGSNSPARTESSFPTRFHYHTIWRDHVRDNGKDLSLTAPLDTPPGRPCKGFGRTDR